MAAVAVATRSRAVATLPFDRRWKSVAGGDRSNVDMVLALALAGGKRIEDAAREADVCESTVYRRRREPDFKRLVQEIRAEMTCRALGRLADISTKAVDTLEALLSAHSDGIKLGAARVILEVGNKLRETVELGERVLYLALIRFRADGCRSVSRSADVSYAENSANRPVPDLYPAPRSWMINGTPLPRPCSSAKMAIFRGGAAAVGDEQWFCRSDEDREAVAERLKLMPCPHCRAVDTLIRHGFLYGFDDSSPPRRTVRARRVFCSNRNARPGCGRTCTVWRADKIRRLSLTTGSLWRFLQRVAGAGIRAAIRAADPQRSDRTWHRLWKRFDLGQCKIRTALSRRCPPPDLPAAPRPAAHTLAHLHAAFPAALCPIAAFQQTMRTFFV
jgi:hypothetical protein